MCLCSLWKRWWPVAVVGRSRTKNLYPSSYSDQDPQMCTKLITTMACGHSFTRNAAQRSPCSSPCSTSPVQHKYLNDTCAKCDPESRRRRVKLEYEYRHAELMQLYMAAKKAGDENTMARLEQLMAENTRVTRQKNFEVSLVSRDPDVVWREDFQEPGHDFEY
ncbi:hypothetical protein EDB80DRAFT_773040 [Ilyonectria destructans]|nr:hypothetical protein EDB80DRAFT_773040 [Ilyonectria destructans]